MEKLDSENSYVECHQSRSNCAAVTCAQDMMYAKNIIESLELEVELPMVLELGNREAVALINSWSVGGRTQHTGVRLNYLPELKEQGVMVFQWVSGHENDADIHTKNVPGPLLEKHCRNTVCSIINSNGNFL